MAKTSLAGSKLELPAAALCDFCERWSVARMWLFGSALRDDFSPTSDVDLLVEFADDARPTLWNQMTMEEELAAMFARPVDLVDRAAVEESRNWIRRREILSTAKEIYVAG